MAVLGGIGARRGAWAAALLASVGAGCAVLRFGFGPARYEFSHRQHVQVEELECVICHEDAFTDDAPGMPYLDTCLLCHEELDETEPEERRVETLFDADEEYVAALYSELAGELVFSHALHVQADLECSACHRGIDANERLGPGIGVDMAACIDCHATRGIPRGCADCHTEIDAAWRPPSHDRNWELLHGAASRVCDPGSAADCAQCHTESECADCHLADPPTSHTNAFRRVTHGFEALLDRDSCATCHEPDSCETCHADTRPRDHVGRFGGTKSRHCLGCHFPLRTNGCVTCHEGTPSHLLAAPKPDWHTPAMNCRQCHGVTEALPHVDKGDDCNACHL